MPKQYVVWAQRTHIGINLGPSYVLSTWTLRESESETLALTGLNVYAGHICTAAKRKTTASMASKHVHSFHGALEGLDRCTSWVDARPCI